MKFKFLQKNHGSAAIAFILIAAASSFYLVKNTGSLMKVLNKEKKKFNVEYITEKFTQGVFNYTVYAIQNRWCMDESWDRDYRCGYDMEKVILNPLNLERLLWSKSAISAIKDSYLASYKKPIASSPGLKEVKASIAVSSLAKLKVDHPLNMALEPRLKNCIDSIDIKVSKYLITSNLSKGDETILSINISAKKKDNSSCSHIKGNIELNSEVAFYPRTLNVFSVIKAGDLDLSSNSGRKSDYGVRFNSKVYVEKDLIIPSKGYYPFGFYDSLLIGGGDIYRGNELFEPKSYGGMESLTYSQIDNVLGINGGVSLEQEVDKGISPLFGGSFSYPENTILYKCIGRAKYRDNPSKTSDSRLFIYGSNGDYTLGLSESNEFREYSYYGKGADNSYIHSLTKNQGASKNLKVNYNNKSKTTPPVMSLEFSLIGESSNPQIVLLGRSTDVDVNLMDVSAYKSIYNALGKEDEYIDFNGPGMHVLVNAKDLKKDKEELEDKCADLKNDHIGESHSRCKVVDSSFSKEVNCNSTSDVVKCKKRVKDVIKAYNDFNSSRKKVLSTISTIVSSPPTLNIRTNDRTAGQVDIKFNIKNESTLKNDLLNEYKGVKTKINPFDFAIEQTSNPMTGKRTEEAHLPGPNEPSDQNILYIKPKRSSKGGSYKKMIYQTGDENEIRSQIASKGRRGWTILKHLSPGSEPPRVRRSLGYKYSEPYLSEGYSTKESKKLDEECLGVFDVDSSEWDVSFTDNTQFSWLVNVTHSGISIEDPSKVKPVAKLVFTHDLMRPGNYKGIPNRSIIKKCIVPSSISTIFGFFVCEEFVVQPRQDKLTVIGTIITKKLNISKAASAVGVDFYSIWHPTAVNILRKQGHLRKSGGEDCNFSEPGWSPFLSSSDEKDLELCSPMRFIYEGINNFNWTTVDPEIGIPADGSSVTTKSKIPNRYRRYTSRVLWVDSGVLK